MKSIIGLSVALAAALSFGGGSPAGAQSQAGAVHDDGQWTMPGKDYASTRYSGLAQITASNAKRLRPMWSFSTGVLGGHEGQPLVVERTMYVVTPYPNVLYAFDLTREGIRSSGSTVPSLNPAAIGIACCDVINRGAVYADGKIVYNLLDGHTVAVDADTGKEVWKTKVADIGEGETTPMAPLVVKERSSWDHRAASSAFTAGSRRWTSPAASCSGPR